MNTATIREAIHRLDGWLSHGPVFCAESGAVAGVTNDEGVVYWYGEIGGYYLAYLASLMVESSGSQKFARHAAKQVGLWLQAQWEDVPALTRLYRGPNVDWRNDYVFAFDLAIILKGLASVRCCGLDTWHGRQIAAFIKVKLVDDQRSLRAVYARRPGNAPNTWSTNIDGHQLKAAAGLIAWGTHFNDHTIYDLGNDSRKKLSGDGIYDWPHLPLHPRLYALEGSLLCELIKPDSIAALLRNALACINYETERTDVIAQFLQLALLAKIEGKLIDRAASHLLESIETNGSVIFRLNQANKERNTWCAIFARQALRFYHEARCGRQLQSSMCI